MRARLLAVALLLTAGLAHASGADPEAFREVAAWLERTIDERAIEGSGAELRTVAVEARDMLVERDVDRRLAGALVLPSGSEEVSTPQESRAMLKRTVRRLRAFSDAMERPAPAVPADAAARVEKILEDPVFDTAARGPGPVERQLRRLREFLAGLVERMLTFTASHGRAMVWITALLAVAALVFFVVRFIVPLFGTRPYRAPLGYETVESLLETDVDPRELLAAAREALAGQQAVQALKLLERAAILALQRRGLLPDRPGLTDLESLALLRVGGAGSVEQDFRALAEIHDRLVYGGRRPDEDHLRRADDLATRIVSAPEAQPA